MSSAALSSSCRAKPSLTSCATATRCPTRSSSRWMKTGTPEAKYATSPRSRTTATTALISWAPAGGVGKCSCVGIDPPGFGDAQTITHHTPEPQANKPGLLPMSGVLKLVARSLALLQAHLFERRRPRVRVDQHE